MLPQKYETKHEIVTFDWDVFYIESKDVPELKSDLNNSKFIQIGENLVSTFAIKIVRPQKIETSILEKLLVGKPDEIKTKVREKMKTRENEGLKTTEGIISNIIKHYETD